MEGEVAIDVKIKRKTCARKHRFIVVSDMVTKVILGMDFWARVGVVTLDLEKMILRINSKGVSVPLLPESERDPCSVIKSQTSNDNLVKVEHSVVIPAYSEMFVICTVNGLIDNQPYLLCPKRRDDSPVPPPTLLYSAKRG